MESREFSDTERPWRLDQQSTADGDCRTSESMNRFEELRRYFHRADANSDGFLQKAELLAAFGGAQAAEFLEFCDDDGDGNLTCDEFVQGILKDTGDLDDAEFERECLAKLACWLSARNKSRGRGFKKPRFLDGPAVSGSGWAAMEPKAGLVLLPLEFRAREDEVVVEVECCGVCGSDLHMIDNDWGFLTYPLVPGHEIVGVVVWRGPQVADESIKIGMRVGVGHLSRTCDSCRYCLAGDDSICELPTPTAQKPHTGGFGTHVVASAKWVFPIPESLSSPQAAPLLCGGITVYAPLLAYQVQPGDRVGVIGLGGLGHLAIQFAKAWGTHVTVFSSSPEKEALARSLGAHAFVSSQDQAAMERCRNSLDFIYYVVPYDLDFELYLSILRRNGKLCVLASSGKPMQVQTTSLFLLHKSIVGRNIGSAHWTTKMLEFAALHDIKAVVETFPMEDVNVVLDMVKQNKVNFRAVLTHQNRA